MMKRLISMVLVLSVMMLFFTSCKKEVQTEPVVEEKPVQKVEEKTPKVEKPQLTEEEIFQRKSLQELNKEGHLKMIHFDFDKYDIKDEWKPVLQSNADWLMDHGSVTITIEGHCDERGTVEYNMALGEKRAKAAQEYVVKLGLDASRIKVISYGKGKPLVDAHNEEAWAKNRRAEFVITSK